MDNQNNLFYDVYNNPFIGGLSIYSVLKNMKNLSVSKSMLIIPFISHKQTISYLKNKNVSISTLDQLIVKKPDLFSNYNERYYSFLTLSINSLLLLIELGVVRIQDDVILLNNNINFDFEKHEVGERLVNINETSLKLAKILEEKEKNLYLQLKVKL